MPARSIHRGDGGETQLLSGQRVRKDDLRIGLVGDVDELSSFLGLARAGLATFPATPSIDGLAGRLRRIQRELYRLGAELARRGEDEVLGVAPSQVECLDDDIATLDASLPPLRDFILPGGGLVAAYLHVARAVCRRVERQAVALSAVEALGPNVLAYLNRLSLLLFSMARQAAHLVGGGDDLASARTQDPG